LFRLYVQAARTPGAILPLVASFAGGGLPIGMLTLAVLLLVRLQSGSLLEAGVMAAALSTGNAVGVAVQGALIDRRGQTAVLIPASLICLSSLLALLLVTGHGGAASAHGLPGGGWRSRHPGYPSSMRALWASLLVDPSLRMAAYALSAVSFTVATVLGPVLVSGLLLLGGPQAAVLAAAGLAGGGGLLFAVTPASRRWVLAMTPRRPLRWPGRGMRTLIAGNLAIGLAAGLAGIAVPAAAITLGAASLAGVFGAAGAAGDLCGGLLYGSRRWRLSLATRLVAAQCGSAVTGVCLALASGSVPAMMLVLPVSGAAGAAQGITTTALLDDIAEPGMLTGSYALLVSCGLAGSAAGYGVGGTLVNAAGIRDTLLVAAAAGLAAAGWYAIRIGGQARDRTP
jgi:MFS family permease